MLKFSLHVTKRPVMQLPSNSKKLKQQRKQCGGIRRCPRKTAKATAFLRVIPCQIIQTVKPSFRFIIFSAAMAMIMS